LEFRIKMVYYNWISAGADKGSKSRAGKTAALEYAICFVQRRHFKLYRVRDGGNKYLPVMKLRRYLGQFLCVTQLDTF